MHPVIRQTKEAEEERRREKKGEGMWLPEKMNACFDPFPLPCCLFVFYLSLYFTLSYILISPPLPCCFLLFLLAFLSFISQRYARLCPAAFCDILMSH